MRRVASSVVAIACAWLAVAGPAHAEDAEALRTASLVVPTVSEPVAPPLVVPPVIPRRFETLSIVLGGDLGMNASAQAVAADHVMRHGRRYAFGELTRGLTDHLKGDLVFANLETVVTARNSLSAWDKTFTFRSHPLAVRHLVRAGFNVFSAANNHVIDYGIEGMLDTIEHLDELKSNGLKAYAGLGNGREAAIAAADITLPQARVRFAAAGIGGAAFGGQRPAMASYHGTDFMDATRALGDAHGDIKFLSVHFGAEMQIRPSTSDERKLRDAVMRHGIDVVAGHHAHVAAGVQEVNGRVIFYGLGNLMHAGMRDMAGMGVCRDFGVLATVHFGRFEGERYRLRAIEVRTLSDMHAAVQVRSGDDARRRVAVLNHLADGLDDERESARGVRFKWDEVNAGLYCAAGADAHDDALAARCRTVSGQPLVRADRSTAASCGGDMIVSARRAVGERRMPSQSPVRAVQIKPMDARFDYVSAH